MHDLVPLPGKEDEVPEITRQRTVVMQTTAGEIRIALYPEAAPNAVARFADLVESGYYDNTPISRVVVEPMPFVAQFGINWREPHNARRDEAIFDDPSLFALERGTLAFAKSGRPDTASTQVFINLKENNYLAADDPSYRFWVFGMVVEGMDVVDRFLSLGDPSMGLDQGRLWANGDAYLDSLPVKPTMIETARVR